MLVFFGGSRHKVFCSAMRDSLRLCETVELRAVGNFPERFYARVGIIDRDGNVEDHERPRRRR